MGLANILVVENERITANDIKKSLEKAGYYVPAIVSTGEDAIKFSEEYKPDLVLMDIKLNGKMDGIEAAETIGSKFAIPVIYLTSYSDDNTVERAKTTHPSAFILKEPFGFLHKPFEENELCTAIEIILNRNNEENRLKIHDKLLSSSLKAISDAIIATDQDKNIKFINSAAEKITGLTEEESIGKNLYEVLPDLELKTDTSGGIDLKDIVNGEVQLNSKSNFKIPVEGTITPITDENGHNNGLIIIFKTF